jgi:hypothetical protein
VSVHSERRLARPLRRHRSAGSRSRLRTVRCRRASRLPRRD